jgi:very-short-patch-repair endonuclease
MLLMPPDPRRVSTSLANRLWARLRLGRIAGFHFSRQAPVGRLVADFYCPEAHLVVQLESARTADQARNVRADQFALDGYRVVRVSEYELIDDLEAVVRKIGDVLRVSPRAGAMPRARSFPL